jgi:hypothetical protein
LLEPWSMQCISSKNAKTLDASCSISIPCSYIIFTFTIDARVFCYHLGSFWNVYGNIGMSSGI